jgi:hypothetical protein
VLAFLVVVCLTRNALGEGIRHRKKYKKERQEITIPHFHQVRIKQIY